MKQKQKNKIEWREVEIGEMGKIITGNTPPKNDPLNYGDKTPWIKPPNLDNSMYVYQSEESLSEIGTQKSRVLPAGSVLVSCIGNIGKIAVSGCEVCTNQQINSIVPNEDISPEFLYYDLKKNQKKIELMANKAVVPILNKTQFSKIKIPIPFSNGKPDIREQERIVKVLEEAEEAINKSKKAEKLLDEYLKSVFYEMFYNKGFEEKTLNEVCLKITDGTHVTPKYVEKGIPFLRVTDITESNSSKKFITKKEHNELIRRCKPERGDVLYTKNGTIGIAKIVDWDYEFSIFVSLCLIKPNKKILLSKYLEGFLNTPYALEQALRHSKKGTITNLHLIEIKQIEIPLPPIHLQEKFASIVEQIEKMKENINKTKQNSEELFNSLINKAFGGEL